jgi:aerobic carbon-monoxide dehydrogenase medium subunit
VKAPDFSYHDPRTLAELIDLLADLDDAKLLAGGQSLMPMLNLRLLAPGHVIDINRIPELVGIRIDGGMVEIGAMTRQADLLASNELAEPAPIFRKALAHVGHVQTRSRGTIGGSCCHLDPAAEQPALCALLDAEFDAIGPNGARTIPAGDWFQGYLQSALDERELLRAIRFRSWPQGHGAGFAEYARRRGDFAIAGAAALLDTAPDRSIRRAAIVVFGVEPSPVRLVKAERMLVGGRLDHAAIELAMEEARTLDAMTDAHISADYRLHLVGIMVRRALSEAGNLVEVPA